jgi:ribosome biogenesis GTPase
MQWSWFPIDNDFSQIRLGDVGWTDAWAAAFADAAPPGTVPGRVARADRGEAIVVTDEGVRRVASDAQRAQNTLAPATGDWVAVGEREGLGEIIELILPRATAMVRRDPAEEVIEQVLVANADTVAVVHGLDRPVNPGRMERFLILAKDAGSVAAVILTKADTLDDAAVAAAVAEVEAVAHGVEVLAVSPREGEGMDGVRDLVAGGGTVVFIGASGVGKSSLVNALVGYEVQAVTEVRSVDAKGRHTTTTRELLPIPTGGVVIDTPGVRAVGVWAADEAIDSVYGDIVSCAAECRFRDCTHRDEPGCAVTAAVSAGTLDADRLERYQRLWQEVAQLSDAREERARKKRRGRRRR